MDSHNQEPKVETETFEFRLPWEFWDEYKDKDPSKDSLHSGWTDYFNKYFATANDICVLSFEYHSLPKGFGKNINVFHAKAHCKHSGCATYHFNIRQSLVEQMEITVHAERIGKIVHTEEIHRRFFKGDIRDEVKMELEKSPPSVVKFKMIGQVPERILMQGNRNNAPSDVILQKMSSENNMKKDLDKEFYLFLEKLRNQYREDPKYKGNLVTGFIQEISITPFYITMYTERALLYAINLSKQKYFPVRFDGTGSIIDDPPGNQKRPYYYTLLLEAEASETGQYKPALSLLEFISTAHNVPYLTLILSTLADTLRKLSKSGTPVLRHIEMDFSMAEIQATLKAFNEMTVLQYLQFVWDAIENKNMDKLLLITIVHICSSHLISGAKRRIRAISSSDEIRIRVCNVITAIIHCTDLNTGAEILKHAIMMFNSEYEGPQVKEAIDFFKNVEDRSREMKDNFVKMADVSQETDNEDNEKESDPKVQYKKSPFFQYFNRVFKEVESTRIELKKDVSAKRNSLFCIAFVKYLLKKILAFFPLVSGLVIQLYGIRRDTNNGVENWFGFVKNVEFGHKMKLLIPRFIQRHEVTWNGRFMEVMFGLQTTRQMKKRQEKNETDVKAVAEESNCVDETKITDKEKSKRNSNHFFTMSKVVANAPTSSASQICDIKNSLQTERRALGTDSSNVIKPWIECYNFNIIGADVNLVFDGVNVNQRSLETLLPTRHIDDCIIDALPNVLASKYNNSNALNFGFYIVKSLLGENESVVLKFSRAVDPNRFPIWILPILDETIYGIGHWTMFIIIPSKKLILYLDSLINTPPISWINKICSFINFSCNEEQIWSEWNLHAPTDIPKQGSVVNSSGNCGAHVCVWYYIIYSGQSVLYSEEDMNMVRSWVMKLLTTTKSFDNRSTKFINKKSKQTLSRTLPLVTQNITVMRTVPSGFRNTIHFCASLKDITN